MSSAAALVADGASYDVSATAALAALREHRGPVLLDLDETLYLRNSTEDFLDSAWPGTLALILLRLLDVLRPWRWTGGEATRDVWRVRLTVLALPWTARRWQARVPALAAAHGNAPLLDALRGTHEPCIVTDGFEPIAAPLLDALGLRRATLVASSIERFADRRAGKLSRVTAALGEDVVRRSMVLTDSTADEPLLRACARPLRTVWPQARYRRALAGVYLPGQYLTQVKRPGEHYIARGILQEDFAFWILSTLALAASPLQHVLGLAALLLSFWAVYELGYVDNDRIAARFESNPKLTEAFHDNPVATPTLAPWIWALGSGAIGIALLRWPHAPPLRDLAAWTALLAATYAWFYIYNRVDKASRVWLYPGLQLARSSAFVVVVPLLPAGAVALGAHLFARWLPYITYRSGGGRWPEVPLHLVRLVAFVLMALLVSAAGNSDAMTTPTMGALLAWNLFRARTELADAARRAHRIDRTPPS